MVNPYVIGGAMLGGMADGFGASSANKRNNKILKKALEQIRALLGEQSVAGAEALFEQRRGLRDLRSGYGDALEELRLAQFGSDTEARDIAQQQMGDVRQGLLNSGNYDAMGMNWHGRGIGADLSRALAAINSAYAQNRAGLLSERGRAFAGQRGAIAGQIGQNFQQRADITGEGLSLQISNMRPYQPMSQGLGSLLYGLSSAFGGGGKSLPYDQQPGFIGPPK